MSQELLSVSDLKVHFPVLRGLMQRRVGVVRAVDGVSFGIDRGRTLGLVGESGCGKSTTGRAVLQLVAPTAGSVRLEGRELTTLSGSKLRDARRDVQMVFQDPYASLNPRMTVLDTVAEPLIVHRRARDSRQAHAEVAQLLETVGLDPSFVRRYPHEFSGGQRQRIGIARALVLKPKLLVCDEPISALDVSIQAQILNLLVQLQRDLGLAFLFIAHDLAAVRHVSHDVAVMYLGRIVERAPSESLFGTPRHPYTQSLLSAVPVPDPALEKKRKRIVLRGDVPSPMSPPPGCHFHTRCPYVMDRCRVDVPTLVLRAPNHLAACHLDEATTLAHAQALSPLAADTKGGALAPPVLP